MSIYSTTSSKNYLVMIETIGYFIAFITMIIIPVYHWYLPPLMILWFILWFFKLKSLRMELQEIPFDYKILFVLFISFYLWQIIGLIYSDYPEAGWRNIVLRLSLLVFPLVLISPGDMIRLKVKTLLRVFAFGTFFFMVFCYTLAVYRSFNLTDGILTFNPHPPVETWLNYFFGSSLAIFQHPSYLSMYVLFSAFIAAESFFDKSLTRFRRMFWLFVSLSLFISIFLLASRAAILASIITIPFYFIYKNRKTDLRKMAGLVVLISIFCIFLLLPIIKSNSKFRPYFNSESKVELGNNFLKESRLVIWKSSFNIIRRHILFGVGTGEIQFALNKEYKLTADNNLAIKNNLNAHNQFLEVLLENGLIGILIFLSLFAMLFYISIKEENLLFILFILIVFISFMFETMINRLAGVSFFALFSFLLPYSKKT
jgi:O-antigen ligase